jgi:aminoglycoside 2'-N-acetyltransferase I
MVRPLIGPAGRCYPSCCEGQTVRIEIKDGASSRDEIAPLNALVYPPEILREKVWREVQSARPSQRVLVYDDDDAVIATVGIHFRSARVDGAAVGIAGIGGVMTHPALRKGGIGRAAMLAAQDVIAGSDAEFGVLFCEPLNERFYRHLGWWAHEGEIIVEQKGASIHYEIMTAMVRPFAASAPSQGEIDLCGLPW